MTYSYGMCNKFSHPTLRQKYLCMYIMCIIWCTSEPSLINAVLNTNSNGGVLMEPSIKLF